jgi:hypothetical protein
LCGKLATRTADPGVIARLNIKILYTEISAGELK